MRAFEAQAAQARLDLGAAHEEVPERPVRWFSIIATIGPWSIARWELAYQFASR